MPRRIRLTAADLTFHVTVHATGRSRCFPKDHFRYSFKRLMADLVTQYPIEIHAFALMDNHLHLMLTPREESAMPRFMQCLLSQHARSVNRANSTAGHLWAARYHTTLIESRRHALNTSLYIDANPWRAFLVNHPERSTWTSYRELAFGEDASFIVAPSHIFGQASDPSWKEIYRGFMKEYIERGPRSCIAGRARMTADPLAGMRLVSQELI
jgi:putative transposase